MIFRIRWTLTPCATLGMARGLLCGAIALALAPSGSTQKGPPPKPQIGAVVMDQSKDYVYSPADGHFKSPGKIRIILTDAVTGEKTVLVADDAEGRVDGDIVVHGAVRMDRPEGMMSGRDMHFNTESDTGSLLEAQVNMGALHLTGSKVEILPGNVIRATDASFTTCVRGRPDFHITARSIEASSKGGIKARRVTFYLGRTRIITLPSMQKSFGHGSSSPLPLPGYSTESGIHLRFRDQAIATSDATLDYNIQLSSKRTPDGTVAYEHTIGPSSDDDAPPRTRIRAVSEPLRTALEADPALLHSPSENLLSPRRTSLYALVTVNSFVYNRTRTDLQVGHLPEVGVSWRNILNRSGHFGDPNQNKGRVPSAFGTAFFSPANWLVNAEIGAGYVREAPSRIQTGRLGLRADASSPLFLVTNSVYARYGATVWSNAYATGDRYSLFAPEAELDYLLGRSSIIGAGYRAEEDFGKTPFLYDALDVRHEMRLRYGYLGGDWAYDFNLHYDLERSRTYDTIVGIRRRLDCMEFGIVYRARSQGFSFVFNLLPPAVPKKNPTVP